MTESSINHDNKYMFVPEENTIPNKLNEVLSTGIKPDETYHLRNPANTAFCCCGSLMNSKCGSKFPPGFFDLLDDENNVMEAFTKEMWYSLRNLSIKEEYGDSCLPTSSPTPEITGKRLKIPISNSENFILDLRKVNGDFKRGSIKITDKLIELGFPTKTLTGKQVLCLIYNNKAEFRKTFSSKKRSLDIMVWDESGCEREWYVRFLMIEDKSIQICANKKVYLSQLESTDSCKTFKIRDPIWKQFNKSELIDNISLEVMGKSIDISLTNREPTIHIKEINKSMKFIKDQVKEDFIENLILGDERLDEMQLCELRISLAKYKLDEYLKTELSEVDVSVFKELSDEYQRLQNLYHNKFIVNSLREDWNDALLLAMQFRDRYLLKLKNGYNYIVDHLSETNPRQFKNGNSKEYSVLFTMKAYQPKDMGCWINTGPTEKSFNIADIYLIHKIPNDKSSY